MNERNAHRKWIELQWKGQRLYLPEYTKIFRKVENEIVESLLELKFEECLFPKLLTYEQYSQLKNALPRFSREWSKEVINASNSNEEVNYPKKYTLAHWQCEPFYYLLKKIKPNNTLKYFDRSGWTYRVEKDVTDYRLFEFQRIESVWFSSKEEAERIQNALLSTLGNTLSKFGLDTRISVKEDEEKESGELKVRDIEVFFENFGWIEVIGMHLHGRLFIEKLGIPIDNDYYTGCCGIGTSRITNILATGDLNEK
jgi:seryl-tRNA synthetase